jgi:hypothetical protein
MSPQLLSLFSEWPNLALAEPLNVIGREEGCEVRIESSRVSRRHCCIALLPDVAVVRDLGSTNGTTVNGQPVQALALLHHGDELGIAHLRYRLDWPPPPDDHNGDVPRAGETALHVTIPPTSGGAGSGT